MDQLSKRKPRFTDAEISVLIDNVEKNYNVISSKFSDSISWKKKTTAWIEITQKVNACAPCMRSVEEIRKKWDDLKCRTKRKAAAQNREFKQIGGGKKIRLDLTQQETRIIGLLGQTRISGICGGLDTADTEDISKFVDHQSTASAPGLGPEQQSVSIPVSQSTKDDSLSKAANNLYPVVVSSCSSSSIHCQTATDRNLSISSKSTPVTTTSCSPLSQGSILTIGKTKVNTDIIKIELERLDVEKKRLEIEQGRYDIEKRNLAVQERILSIHERRLHFEEMRYAKGEDSLQ